MVYNIDTDKLGRGDPDSFRKLFEFMYPKLTAYACRFVDEQTAQDMVQDLFASYWEKKHTIRPDNISAFLYRWLQNRCLDHIKHLNVVAAHRERIGLAEQRIMFMNHRLESHDPLKQVAAKNTREVIEEAIGKLPPRCAEAFRLCYFEDMSHKEVAERMGISSRTAEVHIHNAVGFLRKELRDVLVLGAVISRFLNFF